MSNRQGQVPKLLVLLVFLLAGGWPSPGRADRGLIPFRPHAAVFEPNQRALIAWNGEEEILVLSTDLHASEATQVLEVLPLPSEPEVKKADPSIFYRATQLINRKLARDLSRSPLPAGHGPAGEVTFHARIGAHDISVTRVLEAEKFVDWVESFLKKSGVARPVLSPDMKAIIAEYLQDGFTWFVFDVVAVDPVPKTIDPIQYRFKTPQLYYPMRITRTARGYTAVELLVLTRQLLSRFPGLPGGLVDLRHWPVTLTPGELYELSPDIYGLLGSAPGTQLRLWRLRGPAASFTKDLLAQAP